MTSLDSQELHVGSVSSLCSIRDAIESCQSNADVSCALWLMSYHTFDPLDRQSKLMSSTTRVVSSYSSLTTRADDPRPVDDDEENLMTPRPCTRTPQEAFANDLDWDEDELVTSACPSLQPPEHTSDENYGEAQSTASRILDERSPLLPRAREEASQLPSLQHSQSSVPRKSTTVGQSTFFQTVSHNLPFLQVSHSTSRPAFQRYRLIAWHWAALRASCVLLCRVDLWNRIPHPLRLHHVLYVCHSCRWISTPQSFFLLTSSFEEQKFWRALWSPIRVFALMRTLAQRRLVCALCLS
jgi:hypothetical protein